MAYSPWLHPHCLLACLLLLPASPTLLPAASDGALLLEQEELHHYSLLHQLRQLVRQGKLKEAICLYQQQRANDESAHRFELLEQLAIELVLEASKSEQESSRKIALLAAAFSGDELLRPLLHRTAEEGPPQLQLLAFQLMAQLQDPALDRMLRRTLLHAPHPLLRLIAISLLIEQGEPQAIGQLEALMQKLPEELWTLQPPLLAQIDSRESHRLLRRLLFHPCTSVVIEALHAIDLQQLSPLLPQVRSLLTHSSSEVKEAALHALASLGDSSALEEARRYCRHPQVETAIAANYAAYRLGGDKEAIAMLQQLAQQGNLWAIQPLAQMGDPLLLLVPLQSHKEASVRVNATIALLEHHCPSSLERLLELFGDQAPHLFWLPLSTPGKALSSYKLVPLERLSPEERPMAAEMALRLQEEWLEACYGCSEQLFLQLAEQLIGQRHKGILPHLFALLERHPSDGVTAFLEKESSHLGFPLVRHYSTLTLFHQHQKEEQYQQLIDWLRNNWQRDLFSFRPAMGSNWLSPRSSYRLQPNEEAYLFLEILETVAARGDSQAIDLLLQGLQESHPNHSPLLGALLLRCCL